MDKRLKFAIPLVVLASIFLISGFNFSLEEPINDNLMPINYHSSVCKQVLRSNGMLEEAECGSNVLYNTGAEMIENLLGDGTTGAVLNISLGNASADAGDPQADASEDFTVYAAGGLSSIEGTKSSNGNGNWTVTKTFTATADNLLTNVTRLTNLTGTNFAGNNFTLVTLQTNDQLTINWTVWVT